MRGPKRHGGGDVDADSLKIIISSTASNRHGQRVPLPAGYGPTSVAWLANRYGVTSGLLSDASGHPRHLLARVQHRERLGARDTENLREMIMDMLHVLVNADGDTIPHHPLDNRLGSAVITRQRVPCGHDQLLA
jgi:hypothetical protein